MVCACLDLSVSSSSWCLGRAAVCDCGTPWTFLLPFLGYNCYVIFCHFFLHCELSHFSSFMYKQLVPLVSTTSLTVLY